jgi:hypothetical protein
LYEVVRYITPSTTIGAVSIDSSTSVWNTKAGFSFGDVGRVDLRRRVIACVGVVAVALQVVGGVAARRVEPRLRHRHGLRHCRTLHIGLAADFGLTVRAERRCKKCRAHSQRARGPRMARQPVIALHTCLLVVVRGHPSTEERREAGNVEGSAARNQGCCTVATGSGRAFPRWRG